MCHRQPITIGGSGSTYLYGYVDATFKEKMNVDECKDFVTKGVYLLLYHKDIVFVFIFMKVTIMSVVL